MFAYKYIDNIKVKMTKLEGGEKKSITPEELVSLLEKNHYYKIETIEANINVLYIKKIADIAKEEIIRKHKRAAILKEG